MSYMEGTNGSDEIEPALGASTGVFVLLWVATLIGWISTLFLWRHCSKQNSLHHKPETDNIEPHPSQATHSPMPTEQSNYSSLGPAYEQVEHLGIDGDYDVITRGGAPRPHPQATPILLHDQEYSSLGQVGGRDGGEYQEVETGMENYGRDGKVDINPDSTQDSNGSESVQNGDRRNSYRVVDSAEDSERYIMVEICNEVGEVDEDAQHYVNVRASGEFLLGRSESPVSEVPS